MKRPDFIKPPGQWLVWPKLPKTLEGWIAEIVTALIVWAVLFVFAFTVEPWLRGVFPWIRL